MKEIFFIIVCRFSESSISSGDCGTRVSIYRMMENFIDLFAFIHAFRFRKSCLELGWEDSDCSWYLSWSRVPSRRGILNFSFFSYVGVYFPPLLVQVLVRWFIYIFGTGCSSRHTSWFEVCQYIVRSYVGS